MVFYVNQNEDIQGTGYAVYLKDIEPFAYSDSLGMKHNTSADIAAFDGNGNTHAMYSTGTSPAASAVFDMWQYGQSAYIPSVAQIKLLYQARSAVNTYIASAEAILFQTIRMSVGIGLRQRLKTRKLPKPGYTR